MDRDMQDIKWELTHESYVKEKFAQYHSWFMQLEEKIQLIDAQLLDLKRTMQKITNNLEMHQQVIVDDLQRRERHEKEKIHKEEKDVVKGLTFFDKVFRRGKDDGNIQTKIESREKRQKEMYDMQEDD